MSEEPRVSRRAFVVGGVALGAAVAVGCDSTLNSGPDSKVSADGRADGGSPDRSSSVDGVRAEGGVGSPDGGVADGRADKGISADATASTDTAASHDSAPSPDAGVNRPPVWQTVPNQTWTVGVPVYLDLASYCSDPDGDALLFSLSAALPPGLTLTGSVISGTPTAVFATTTVTATADDQKP